MRFLEVTTIEKMPHPVILGVKFSFKDESFEHEDIKLRPVSVMNVQ